MIMPEGSAATSASFRDRSGFVFRRDNEIYRHVNPSYSEHYDQLIESRLYERLTRDGLMVSHEEVDIGCDPGAYRILRPERIPFISYPYEWCFSQLKEAALATLSIQDCALDHGMTLKDASAYNIQFVHSHPVLIDTLSFERYVEGKPWVAYRQFCQHFLAPLALMAYRDARLSAFSRVFLDGVPLDLASTLLPSRSKLRMSLLMHLHLHARFQRRYSDTGRAADEASLNTAMRSRAVNLARQGVSLKALRGIVDSLRSAIMRLSWRPLGTEWGEYYADTNYSEGAMTQKERLVQSFLEDGKPDSVWDLGANTGRFSRLASRNAVPTVAFDIDPAAVEKNFRESRDRREKNLLPLVLDLTNPSPAIGWANRERDSLIQRGPAHTVLALALVHHIAISNNVPFERIASFLAELCRELIIEFVPKEDSQVRRLLATREDIFADYDVESFEAIFRTQFTIRQAVAIEGSHRTLYWMTNRNRHS